MANIERKIVGCMTGTSLDGMDAALVKITGRGMQIRPQLIRAKSWSLGPLAQHLRKAAEQQAFNAGQFAVLSYRLGLRHAALIKRLLKTDRADFACLHGQTVYHQPPITWQMLNPSAVTHRLNLPVLFDLRIADMAMGGQGAPISPIADHFMYRSDRETRVVLNLGGFVNYTWLPAAQLSNERSLETIRGGDICACNQLLDAISRCCFKQAYDTYGENAMGGDSADEVFHFFSDLLMTQADNHRSLGTGDELMEIADTFCGRYRGGDVARSACAAIADTIVRSLGDCDRIILAGGGARNSALVRELRMRADAQVDTSEHFGIPGEYREAVVMAILGALSQDNIPISLPQITNLKTPAPLAGVWMFPSSPSASNLFAQ